MSRAIGISADQLAAAGRADAARQLRAFEQDRGLRQRIAGVPRLGALAALSLPREGDEELLPLIAAGLDAIDHADLPRTAKGELAGMFVDNLIHDATRRHSELLLMLRLATGGIQPR
jgi:hypothetical protein